MTLSDYDVVSGTHVSTVSVDETGAGLDLTVDRVSHRVALIPWVAPTHFILVVDGSSTPVILMRAGGELRVTIGCDQYRLRVARKVPIQRRASGGRSSSGEVGVEAPMPGLIVAVVAQPGSTVEPGAPVVIMEAMKMQLEIRAPRAGRIKTIAVAPGQEVTKGQTLVTIASAQSPPSAQSPQSC